MNANSNSYYSVINADKGVKFYLENHDILGEAAYYNLLLHHLNIILILCLMECKLNGLLTLLILILLEKIVLNQKNNAKLCIIKKEKLTKIE